MRTRAPISVLAFASLWALGCGDPVPLPTTLNTTATQADVAAARAGFNAAAVLSLAALGDEIDARLQPISLLLAYTKTHVWSADSGRYIVSTRTGAPGNATRFVLYATTAGGTPSSPLTERGYVELSGGGSTATVKVFSTTNVEVMRYDVTASGADATPSFSITGSAGTGASKTDFSLTAVTASTGTFTQTWRTTTQSRGLSSVVQYALGPSSATVSASSRASTRKIEVGGSLSETGSGVLIVKVGNSLFGRIVRSGGSPGVEAYTNPLGVPLNAADASALAAAYAWFADSYDVLDQLVAPVYAILDRTPPT